MAAPAIVTLLFVLANPGQFPELLPALTLAVGLGLVAVLCCMNEYPPWLLTQFVIFPGIILALACIPGGEKLLHLFLVAYAPFLAGTLLVIGDYFFRVVIPHWKNPAPARALQLAQSGDVDGGISLLQDQLQQNAPSAPVYSTLALLHATKENWDESLRMIEQAEQLGARGPVFLANKGIVLWKSGRTEEAEPVLREAARLLPEDLNTICNCGLFFASLGRREEAMQLLKQAEKLFANQIILGSSEVRKALQQTIEPLRQAVSALSVSEDRS